MNNAKLWNEFVTDPTCVGDQVLALLRRDWAVRVLDAWALANPGRNPFRTVRDGWATMYSSLGGSGPTPEAARHAAALAVFPSLSAEKRAELGERP